MGASCFIPLCIQFSFYFKEVWPEQRQEVPREQGRCAMCSSSLWQVLQRFPLSASQSAVLSRADEHQPSREILGCAHFSGQHRRDWVRTSDGTLLLSFEGLQWNLHLKKGSTNLFGNLSVSKAASPACCSSCLVAKQTQLVWYGLITLDEALYEIINSKEGWIVNIKWTSMQK